jgi:hypothetical protein
MTDTRTDRWERICLLDNIIEAQLVESILTQRGLAHRIRTFHDTAYDGLFQVQQGWGDLYAQAQDRDQIIEILEDVRHSNLDAGPDPDTGSTDSAADP